MKTAVIYARYSSDRQTEQSIEGQLRTCHEYAERNDIIIVDTYIDRAMTGTNDNRVDFQRMLKDSDKKAWDYVLVYKLDRFSRNKYENAIHKRHLRDNGIKLLSAMENIPDTPEGIILESLLEGMSEYYSAELSQKIRRGMRENRIKGYYTGGGIPFGYKVVNKQFVIDEEEAKIVRYAFTEFIGGRLISDIMREFNEKGIKHRGKPFAKNTLYKILENEKYSGSYHHGDDIFDNTYPRLLSPEVYATARAKLEKNKFGKHASNVCYLLKSKVICGYCGKSVASDSGTSENGKVMRYYKCSGKKNKQSCSQKPIRKELFEQLVIDTLFETMSDEMIEYIASQILNLHEQKMNDNSILNALLKEYRLIEKQINNLLDAITNGIYTESTKARLEKLEEDKSEISYKISLEKSKEKLRLTQNDIIKYMHKAINKKPQAMIDLLVNKIILYKDKIEIYLNYTDTKKPDDENHQVFSFYSTSKKFIIDTHKFATKPSILKYKISLLI